MNDEEIVNPLEDPAPMLRAGANAERKIGFEVLDAENSASFDDDMNFGGFDSNQSGEAPARVKINKTHARAPMFIDGRHVGMDPDALVLNKREKTNSLLNTLFVRLEYDQCMKLIDELGNDTNEENEYALYIKALILRSKHKIN